MNPPSIYKQFSKKLIIATSIFIILLAFIFSGFAKATIYEELYSQLLDDAKLVYKISTSDVFSRETKLLTNSDIQIDLITVPNLKYLKYKRYNIDKNYFIELLYPFNIEKQLFIKITRNINNVHKVFNKILGNLLFLGIGGLIMIILYALTVSKTLLSPIVNIANKLSNMNENSLTTIETKALPIEFLPLATSINTLTKRIETHLKYQKELFIGTAHELKTPLAVMKLKSEVTIRKPRESEKYIETLKLHITEIDKMNKMISSILDMGRQEGAKFEKPTELDIINFLELKTNDYQLIANKKKINIIFSSNIENFITIIQPTLLNQIIQNFVQNAIKFTAENKKILITATTIEDSIKIEVLDEGIGCNDDIDLFAPFQREGKESGAGLGLFLAKSASDALGATISLQNRKDDIQGTIATLQLDINPTCKI